MHSQHLPDSRRGSFSSVVGNGTLSVLHQLQWAGFCVLLPVCRCQSALDTLEWGCVGTECLQPSQLFVGPTCGRVCLAEGCHLVEGGSVNVLGEINNALSASA